MSNIVLEVLAKAIKQEKEGQIVKKEVKLSHFGDNMILSLRYERPAIIGL